MSHASPARLRGACLARRCVEPPCFAVDLDAKAVRPAVGEPDIELAVPKHDADSRLGPLGSRQWNGADDHADDERADENDRMRATKYAAKASSSLWGLRDDPQPSGRITVYRWFCARRSPTIEDVELVLGRQRDRRIASPQKYVDDLPEGLHIFRASEKPGAVYSAKTNSQVNDARPDFSGCSTESKVRICEQPSPKNRPDSPAGANPDLRAIAR
ncbi:hypothetical protein [Bosea sp. PAMC 26642]|uniref:hypothetical protein n=1 Tax=Bosea sp. (strain PAMC 26642) TaxID=1792307 RepID=UPI000B2812C2|nr:hypothetical protein [Bosea sp. PAMC 26642]